MYGHYFIVEDLSELLADLQSKGYSRNEDETSVVYSKTISGALIKHYSYKVDQQVDGPIRIQASYELVNHGNNLQKLGRELKKLNFQYRQTIPGYKTKKEAPKEVRDARWLNLQRFLYKYDELINCFRFREDRLTEGNYWFNLQVASTPGEQKICIEFIKALAEAFIPHGIVRGRRQPDKPVQQRNGWIKRHALILKKQGWRPFDIARDIQKELRNGTWNERSRLQFNIANSTICKIAGIKIPHWHHRYMEG